MESLVPDQKQSQSVGGCKGREHSDPRVRRTRKLLEDAYRDLIGEKPYAEVSVLDITERATVNRATFYAHYVDKQDLAVHVAKADLAASIYRMFSDKPQLSQENLVLFATAVFEFVDKIHKGCPGTQGDMHAAIAVGIQEELYWMTYGWLGNKSNYAELFGENSRETLATVISSSLFGAAFRWVRLGKRAPVIAICTEISSILVRG